MDHSISAPEDYGIGIGKIAGWVSSLLFCPEPNAGEWAEICSLKPVALASSRRKSEAAQALKDD